MISLWAHRLVRLAPRLLPEVVEQAEHLVLLPLWMLRLAHEPFRSLSEVMLLLAEESSPFGQQREVQHRRLQHSTAKLLLSVLLLLI